MCDLHTVINRRLLKSEYYFPGVQFHYPVKETALSHGRLLNWPPRQDGRGWPQQTAFECFSWNNVLLLVRVNVGVEEDEYFRKLSVLVCYNALRDFLTTARVVAVWDGELGMFSQRSDCLQIAVQSVSVENTRVKHDVRPRFSLSKPAVVDNCFHLTKFHGIVSMVKIRLWFKQSSNGRYCAFPSEWHGPGRAHWTSLIVVDTWMDIVVAVLYASGECFFPNKPLASFSVSDEDMSQERNAEFDHANTAVFSPDCSLLSIWQGGAENTLWLIDCERRCQHAMSCHLPQPCVEHGTYKVKLYFSGAVAFDPGSHGQDGRASRIAYTSLSHGSCARAAIRFAVDHTLSVCNLDTGQLLWHYHHRHCIDDIAYNRYGNAVAATVLTSISASLTNWDVLVFNALAGDVLHCITAPHGMCQLYFSPFATVILLLNFIAAASTNDPRPTAIQIEGAFPSLQQLACSEIQKHIFSQAEVEKLSVAPRLQRYIRSSLPIVSEIA